MAAEEAENAKKSAVKGSAKVAMKKGLQVDAFDFGTAKESYAASGIDDAIALLDLAGKDTPANTDKLERHPERRMKSAYAVFEVCIPFIAMRHWLI